MIYDKCIFVAHRYAFRDNMTDVIVQHLITEQKGMFIDSTVVCLLFSFKYQNITSIKCWAFVDFSLNKKEFIVIFLLLMILLNYKIHMFTTKYVHLSYMPVNN